MPLRHSCQLWLMNIKCRYIAFETVSATYYIPNWPLQPLSQDYGLFSHTTHIMCVNFIREWRDLQFNVDSERQIFEKLFHGRFIYSQSFCQKSAERKSPKKYFSYLIFDDWPGIRTQAFASNKPTHNIIDHGDFCNLLKNIKNHYGVELSLIICWQRSLLSLI